MSRILLAVPEQASTFIALVVAAAILGTASFVALKPSISTRSVLTGLVVAGVLLTGGGLVGAAAGNREIEAHKDGGAEHVSITARNVAFNRKSFELHPNLPATIRFDNEDSQPHNLAIYTSEDATRVIFQGNVVVGGEKGQYRFMAPGPGTYFFRCDIHPQMKGTVRVA
jgi:plastocyanin